MQKVHPKEGTYYLKDQALSFILINVFFFFFLMKLQGLSQVNQDCYFKTRKNKGRGEDCVQKIVFFL